MSLGNRLRLYGKVATEEEIAEEVARLYLGDPQRKIEPQNVTQICNTLGYNSRVSIYRYLEKACELKILERDATNNRYKKPEKSQAEEFREYDELHPIVKDPLIAEWKLDLRNRKGGEPISSWQTRINSVEAICNTCRVTPKQLISSTHAQIETIMQNYSDLYRDGQAKIKSDFGLKKRNQNLLNNLAAICKERNFSLSLHEAIKQKLEESEKNKSIKGAIYVRAQGLRDFLGKYNIVWKRGVGGVMSQKIVGHAKYADIRLLDSEFESADKYILSRWGLDSDVYRWFWIGVESCARFNALYNMNLEYYKHFSEKLQKITYLFTAYESKTKHIRGGKWLKYITRPNTQKSVDLLKERDGIKIWEAKLTKKKFQEEMRDAMFEIFLHLSKTNLYFYQHATHVLRHLGAHYWLAKGNYQNHVVVAKIGGWNTVDEMIKSYGELPPEKVIEAVENMQTVTPMVMA